MTFPHAGEPFRKLKKEGAFQYILNGYQIQVLHLQMQWSESRFIHIQEFPNDKTID